MGRIITGLPTDISSSVELISQPEAITEIVEVVKQVDVIQEVEKIVYVDNPIEKIIYVDKIIEIPVIEKQIEYITVTKIETVEVPVEVIVEKVVTIHDIEGVLAERKRAAALSTKISHYQIAVAALIIISTILGAL